VNLELIGVLDNKRFRVGDTHATLYAS